MDKLINTLKDQQSWLLSFIERAKESKTNLTNSKTYQFKRARFIGMIEAAILVGVDTEEYIWIFNA